MLKQITEFHNQGASVWDHVDELRNRLLLTITFLILVSAGCYFFSDAILQFITSPLQKLSQKVYFTSPYDAFVIKLQVSFWSALFITSPLLFTEFWFFIAPGLYQKEKKVFLAILLPVIALFIAGSVLAIFFVVPAALSFFLSFSNSVMQPLLSVEKYFSFVVWMALSFGIAFQMPVLLVGLVWLGILKSDQLKLLRRYLIVIIFIFAAVVTPSPDPFSQCALAVPLWILFEISLLVSRSVERKGD